MTRMSIRRQTRYPYGQAARFGVHRMLLRPRDSHAEASPLSGAIVGDPHVCEMFVAVDVRMIDP